jgi:hypothetical protein
MRAPILPSACGACLATGFVAATVNATDFSFNVQSVASPTPPSLNVLQVGPDEFDLMLASMTPESQ